MHTATTHHLRHIEAERSAGWGWWVALGAVLVLAGAVALVNLATATAVSVLFVGAMMIVGGVAQIALAFPVQGQWGRFFLWLLLGLLYVAAGIVTFRNPALATAVLTLLLAAALVAVGILRIAAGFRLRPIRGWGWVVLSGALTVLVGAIVGAGWPFNSLWVLGLFLAVDLLFSGVAYLAFGLAERRDARL